jgi:hypothetical protein
MATDQGDGRSCSPRGFCYHYHHGPIDGANPGTRSWDFGFSQATLDSGSVNCVFLNVRRDERVEVAGESPLDVEGHKRRRAKKIAGRSHSAPSVSAPQHRASSEAAGRASTPLSGPRTNCSNCLCTSLPCYHAVRPSVCCKLAERGRCNWCHYCIFMSKSSNQSKISKCTSCGLKKVCPPSLEQCS